MFIISNSKARRRQKNTCRYKLKFTAEEAAAKIGNRPADLELYLCSNCQYIHFGHKPLWKTKA